jgi:hypothetical protein
LDPSHNLRYCHIDIANNWLVVQPTNPSDHANLGLDPNSDPDKKPLIKRRNMDEKTRKMLHAKAADVFIAASRKFQPEYVLLWVVDENGQEIEHEFIQMHEALAMVDPVFSNPVTKNPDNEPSTL